MKEAKIIENFYDIHVFCCTNFKSPPNEKNSCGFKGAEELVKYMKTQCKLKSINNIRINQSGCLGRCKLGKVMVIYPEGIWYHYDNEQDIDKIITEHFINGFYVKELVLTNDQTTI